MARLAETLIGDGDGHPSNAVGMQQLEWYANVAGLYPPEYVRQNERDILSAYGAGIVMERAFSASDPER